ncbi:RNA polymerase I specific transcription initiation factor RRN3 like protein, partial [Aduncisulcus paluster]
LGSVLSAGSLGQPFSSSSSSSMPSLAYKKSQQTLEIMDVYLSGMFDMMLNVSCAKSESRGGSIITSARSSPSLSSAPIPAATVVAAAFARLSTSDTPSYSSSPSLSGMASSGISMPRSTSFPHLSSTSSTPPSQPLASLFKSILSVQLPPPLPPLPLLLPFASSSSVTSSSDTGIRIVAASYLASFLSRSMFSPVTLLKECIGLLIRWCKTYVRGMWDMRHKQQAQGSAAIDIFTAAQVRILSSDGDKMEALEDAISGFVHSGPLSMSSRASYLSRRPIYYCCVCMIMYIICFRWRDFVEDGQLLYFGDDADACMCVFGCGLRSLDIVQLDVVSEFAKLLHRYDVCDIGHVISQRREEERRKESVWNKMKFMAGIGIDDEERGPEALSSSLIGLGGQSGNQSCTSPEYTFSLFFPFSPCPLPRSSQYISPIYLVWDGAGGSIGEEKVEWKREESDDDELGVIPEICDDKMSSFLDTFLFFTDSIAETAVPTDSFKTVYLSTAPSIDRAPYANSLIDSVGEFLEDVIEDAETYTSTIADAISTSLHQITSLNEETNSIDLSSFAADSTLPFDSDVQTISREDIPEQFIGTSDEWYQMTYESMSFFIPHSYNSSQSSINTSSSSLITKEYALASAIEQTVASDYDSTLGGLKTFLNGFNSPNGNNEKITNQFTGFQRIITSGGLEFTWPGIYSGSTSMDTSVSIKDRMTREPMNEPGILSANSFGLRRGVVIVLDTTIDKTVYSLLSHELGSNIFSKSALATTLSTYNNSSSSSSSAYILSQITYSQLLTGLLASLSEYISSLDENTYLAVVDTSGEWRGHLFPESSTAAKTCYGQATSTKRTGGLSKMTVEAQTKLISNVKKYFGTLTYDELTSSGHIVEDSSSSNAAYAEENNPMFSATSLAMKLLRSAVEPSIMLSDILTEKIATVSHASRVERDSLNASARPLAKGSPLSIVFMSLGATPHPYFLIWLKKQFASISGAPILPVWIYLDTQRALLDGYGGYEITTSYSSSQNSINSSTSKKPSLISSDRTQLAALRHNVSQIDTIMSNFRDMRGAVLRIDVKEASEGGLIYIPAYGSEYLTFGETLCSSLSSSTTCDQDIIAWSQLLGLSAVVRDTLSELRKIDISFLFKTFINVRCSLSDAADIENCSTNHEFLTSAMPMAFSSTRDPVIGNSALTVSKALFNADLEIVGYIMTYIALNQVERALYQDPVYIDGTDESYIMNMYGSVFDNMFLLERYSYYMMFNIDGALLAHSALTSSGKSSTAASIDELEVILSCSSCDDGALTFSELILDSILEDHVDDGVVSAIVLRQTHNDISSVYPISVEYHWTFREESGFIFVVSLGSRDVIDITDTIMTNVCDTNYPTQYDSSYSGTEYSPLTSKEACYYPTEFSTVDHLDDEDLSLLGYKAISSDYTLFASDTMVYNGVEFFLEDETTMQRLGITSQDEITVELAQDISNYFNGDPSSQTYGTDGELASVRFASMYSYYWTYEYGSSEAKKTVVYANGLIDPYLSILYFYLYPPLGYSLNIAERGYFQQSLGMGYSNADYIFASLFMIYPAAIPVFTIISPIIVEVDNPTNASAQLNEVVRYSSVSMITTTIVNQALNETVCAESNIECYILSSSGEVLFITHSIQFSKVISSVEDGESKFIFDLSPGVGNALLDNNVFIAHDVYCPYSGSIQSEYYLNTDALVESTSLSIGGETITQPFLSGQLSSDCVASNEVTPEFLFFQDTHTNTLAVIITDYPDEDLCTSNITDSSSSSSSTLDYETVCDIELSVYEISHIWSLGDLLCTFDESSDSEDDTRFCETLRKSSNNGMVSFCTFEGCPEDIEGCKQFIDGYDKAGCYFVILFFALLLGLCIVLNAV